MTVEITRQEDVGRGVVGKNLVESFPQGLGVDPARLLGLRARSTGLPVIDENIKRLSVDGEFDFENIAGIFRGMTALGCDGEFAEDHILLRFPATGAFAGQGLQVGRVLSDGDHVTRHAFVREVLEEKSLCGQTTNLVVELAGQHFLDGRILVLLEEGWVVRNLRVRTEVDFDFAQSDHLRTLAVVESLQDGGNATEFVEHVPRRVGMLGIALDVVVEDGQSVGIEQVFHIVGHDGEFLRRVGGFPQHGGFIAGLTAARKRKHGSKESEGENANGAGVLHDSIKMRLGASAANENPAPRRARDGTTGGKSPVVN